MSEASLSPAWEALDREARELTDRLGALSARYGLPSGAPRVEPGYDESGLLASLTFLEGEAIAFDALRTDILRVLVGRIPVERVQSARVLDALVDALDGGDATSVSDDLGSVTVTARRGLIVGVTVSRLLLGSGRPQTICDAVVPVARRAMRETDTLGLFGGGR